MNQETRNRLIRTQLETAAAAIEAAFLLLEEEPESKTIPEGCQHPEEYRQDASTFDKKQFYCRLCAKFFPYEGEVIIADGNP